MTSTKTSTDVIRAGVYERVSTKDQSAARQSYENGRAIDERGWALAATYDADCGKSASRHARHGGRGDHARLLADVAAGRLDVVVLHEVSRADRRTTRWSALLDSCQDRGILIHITSKRRTYDPREWDDRESLLRQGITAEGETETLSMRVKSGKDEGMREGRPQGSVAYGVRRVWDGSKSKHNWLRDEPDPETAPVVRRIVAEAAAGRPLEHIARDLTAEGIPTPGKATAWHGSTVASIARNPVYVAAGVVAEAQSLAARARLARSRRAGERPARQVHRYSNCLACSVCGAPVAGFTDSAGRGRYRCKAGCVSIASTEMDTWIDACAIDRLSRPDLVSLFAQPGDSAAAAAARSEADQLRADLAQWLAVLDTPAEYAAKKAQLQPRIAAAERRAADAEVPSVLAGLPDQDREIVAQRWAALETAARREAVKALAPRAILRPGSRGGRGAGRVSTPVDQRVDLWPDD
jgi:DNA invertase Pin-like site-specific DNA recombinase